MQVGENEDDEDVVKQIIKGNEFFEFLSIPGHENRYPGAITNSSKTVRKICEAVGYLENPIWYTIFDDGSQRFKYAIIRLCKEK